MAFRRKLITSVACALVVACFLDNPKEEDAFLRGLTTEEDINFMLEQASGNASMTTAEYNDKHKPVMHTFFDPIGDTDFNDPMIDAWRDEWTKAGFQTQVLTLDDAKKHPYFETMKEAVEKVFKTDTYNQLCFYRYLAMAANGGGWMSDYDTFPTNFPMNEGNALPNDGKFTSFQAHVPSLISATADEWAKVASLMVDTIPRSEQWLKSDMYILYDLKLEGNHEIEFKLPSYNVHAFIGYKALGVVDCHMLAVGRATHISHYAEAKLKEHKMYPEKAKEFPPKERRAQVSRIFMDDWRAQCGGSKVGEKE